MRLTARGWGMLAAGVAAGVLATALSSLTTARIAALLVLVPLSALVWALITRAVGGRRRVERTLVPPTWQVGRPGSVELRITGRELGPWSSLRERVPAALGRRPAGSRRYDVLPHRRGRYTLGPAVLRRSDPFALVRWAQEVPPSTSALVWPAVEPVDAGLVAGALEATAPHHSGPPRRTLEDLTVREYRLGDDLHRVHWRSTARHGELMVRHDEPTTTEVLDLLVLPASDDELAEWGVAATASVAHALTGAGTGVRVVGVLDGQVVAEECPSAADALDLLAVVEPADTHTALEAVRTVARSGAAGLLAVLDRPDERVVEALRPLAAGRSAGGLVTGADAEHWAARLRTGGWLVRATPHALPVGYAWRELMDERTVRG